MNAQSIDSLGYMNSEELMSFKILTDKLMRNLQGGDYENALSCINEINQINDENLFKIIGKITRGLHNAISDLQLSSSHTESPKSPTKTGLGYVIDVTADAAKTTLDMTEKSRDLLVTLSENIEQQNHLIEELKSALADNPDLSSTVQDLSGLLNQNRMGINEINNNVMEITIAQNYQDLASQSITKSITNIRSVESSLIALTKHTKLLKQISHFTSNPEKLNSNDTEALCQNLEKLELKSESEHMNQDDVDNLLSSLGF